MAQNILTWGSDLGDDRGFYGTGSESVIESYDSSTNSDGEDLAYLSKADATDVYGESVEGNGTSSDNPFLSAREGMKTSILGLPLCFNKLCDPSGRVFKKTFMEDLPVLFVVPGKTVLNNKLVRDTGNRISKGNVLRLVESESLNVLKIGVRGARSGNDVRFLGFKADYSEYYKYVSLFLSTLHSAMGLKGVFNFDNFYTMAQKNYGLAFYCDKSTSISESNNNDFTQSSVAQQANDLASKNREAKLMLGINTAGGNSSFVSKALTFVTQSVSELAEGVTSLSGILSRAGNIFGRVTNGSQLLYPEIWTNSAFSRSYSLSFKWYSPYGPKDYIFKYVYVPFAAWVCLAFPRQDNVMGFGQPFVVRVSCPGRFESSLAAISDISFNRGGDDSLWTVDNLPNEITCTVTIKDLYPALPITKKYSLMSYNIGLSSFIDCMAGIRSDQLNLISSVERWVKSRLSVPGVLAGNFKRHVSDSFYGLQSSINNFLK